MVFKITSLWMPPKVNPVNHKAKSIPVFNPFNIYGRVFFFTSFAYFVSFWSWYAFPPLTTFTIKNDLKLSQVDIANGNLLALVMPVLMRALAGFACDRFGPRMTYIVILLCGAIPTALAPTVQSATGLIVVRCFTGILGAAFVPCQVWAAGFFDKNVVGAVTALAAGLGNAGGGITFFAMPAIFDSLVNHRGLSDGRAWRLAFLVPLLLILTTAGLIAWICPDTPTGPWSARHRALNHQLSTRDMFVSTARSRDGGINEKNAPPVIKRLDSTQSDSIGLNDHGDVEYHEDDLLAAASWELVQKPTISQLVNAVFSIQAVSLFFLHFSSFGAELSVMSLLAAYYYKEFPSLGQTGAGNWAAFFGLLNVFARPFSGLVSDALYRPRGSLWARKIWIHVVGVTAGIFACVIGVANPTTKPALFGLMAAFAFFIEAGNGAQFALVPHVHPSSNGIITGLTSSAGSLGGVVFTLLARHEGDKYNRLLLIIGIWTIATQLLLCWVPPISKRQLGGR